MLRQLIEIWTQKDTLVQVSEKFDEMLRLGRWIFDLVTETLFSGAPLAPIGQDVYRMDQRINVLEQEIRRLVYTKLVVEKQKTITSSLILFSVVKDAERCGDYGKNIYEVFSQPKELARDSHYHALQESRARISFFFDETATIFREGNAAKARRFLKKAHDMAKLCDQHTSEIVGGGQCATPASFALLFRFFKRIVCHLTNICSAVVMPVDKLDYFDEDYRDEIQQKVANGEPMPPPPGSGGGQSPAAGGSAAPAGPGGG